MLKHNDGTKDNLKLSDIDEGLSEQSNPTQEDLDLYQKQFGAPENKFSNAGVSELFMKL